jgi:probable O-glycosylation ligase (exosortase A-associated)
MEQLEAAPGPNWPFTLVLFYLMLEYARPEVLQALHVPALVSSMLAVAVVTSGRTSLSDIYTRLFIALLVLMAAHGPFALNTFWAFHTFRSLLLTFIAYLAIVTFVTSPARFGTLMTAWLGIHAYLALVGIQGGGWGTGGFLGDQNDFSLTLNLVIPFAFFLALDDERPRNKIGYLLLLLLFLAANVTTMSRGGFIGLVTVAIGCWLFSRRKVASGLLLVFIVTLAAVVVPAEYWREIQTIQQGTGDETGAERVDQWKVAWDMFLANPLFGVGQGNLPWEFRSYESAEGFEGRSLAGRAAHSLYFTLLPELGLAGTVIFVAMGFTILRRLGSVAARAWRVTDDSRGREARRLAAFSRAMVVSLIGYLVGGVFISVLYYPHFWLLGGFAVALANVSNHVDGDGSASY